MTTYKIIRKDARTGKETILGFYEEINSAQDAILDLFNEDYDMGCLTWEEAIEATADRIFRAYPSRYGEYSYSYDSDMTRIDTTDGTECKTLEELARVLNQFVEYPHDLVDDTIYMQLWDDLQGEDRDVCGENGYVLTMADNGKYIVVERGDNEDDTYEFIGAIYCTNGDAKLVENEDDARELCALVDASPIRMVQKSEYDEVLPKLNLTRENNVRYIWAFDGGYYCLAEDFDLR